MLPTSQSLISFSNLLECCSESHCLYLEPEVFSIHFLVVVSKFQVLHLGPGPFWVDFYTGEGGDVVSVFYMWVSSFTSRTHYRTFFPGKVFGTLVENQFVVAVWTYSWIFYCISLIFMSVFCKYFLFL
jgi:hypothetical protein